MRKHHAWWPVLVLVALAVAACGPQMATPTAKVAQGGTTPTVKPAMSPTPAPPTATPVPVDLGKLPIDSEDYHVLGPAEALVTIIEYTDFQ